MCCHFYLLYSIMLLDSSKGLSTCSLLHVVWRSLFMFAISAASSTPTVCLSQGCIVTKTWWKARLWSRWNRLHSIKWSYLLMCSHRAETSIQVQMCVVTLGAVWLSVVTRLDLQNKKVCFWAGSLTKSDLEMDVKNLISLVFDRKPL